MNGSEDGLLLASAEAECNDVHIDGFRYGVQLSNATVNFSDCTLSSISDSAILLHSASTIALTGCVVAGGQYGINSHSTQHSLNITDCSFTNNTAAGIHLDDFYSVYTDAVTSAILTLHRNRFYGNARAVHFRQNVEVDVLVEATENVIEAGSTSDENDISVSGIYVDLEKVGSKAHLILRGNAFRNLPYSAVSFSRCHDSPSLGNHSTSVTGNNFTSVYRTAVAIACADATATLIQGNTFLQNRMNVGSSCLNISSTAEIGNNSSAELRVESNEFRENGGTYVVMVIRSGHSSLSSPGGVPRISEFVSNTLVDNFPDDSAIYSENSDLRMHYNEFSNKKTPFELRVGFPTNEVANCTLNWWSVNTEVGIASRIFDHSDSTGVGSVLFVPFLNTSSFQFSCLSLSECSGHGACIYVDVCLCDAGWSGLDCSEFSCVDVYGCSNRGRCVGPNLCQCTSGWLQPDCSRASCLLRNNCSNRGVCSLPNV